MSIELEYRNFEIQRVVDEIIGKVPENKLARLMYYLECVFTVIESDTDKKYTNYGNFSSISQLDEQTILNLVATYNIQLMKDLNLFKVEPDYVPVDKENEFYDITDERFKDSINSEVIIEEKARKVLKVMLCKQSWIFKNYEKPLREYGNRIQLGKYFLNDPNYEEKNERERKQCREFRNAMICYIITLIILAVIFTVIGILCDNN